MAFFFIKNSKEEKEREETTKEEVQASHILIAYQGAERANESVTRTKEEAEEKAAVHTAKMQVIQNTASWEQLMASASATSWKDEWFTLLLSAPVVALMWGIGMNDLEIIERIGIAFTELDRLPDWYQYLLFMAVSASFGIRGADKLLALKGKK